MAAHRKIVTPDGIQVVDSDDEDYEDDDILDEDEEGDDYDEDRDEQEYYEEENPFGDEELVEED